MSFRLRKYWWHVRFFWCAARMIEWEDQRCQKLVEEALDNHYV